mmetsp:Transcript_21164/g.58346  ORF Transcript_21164/g.58346 Transcript_21164/m.58346 type:complete len:303 (+) Transcript_21164:203-1111(+)
MIEQRHFLPRLEHSARHELQPQLARRLLEDLAALLLDERPQRARALLLRRLALQLRRLLLLVQLPPVLQQPLHLPLVFLLPHPPLLRVHQLDALVLGELGQHARAELLLLPLLLLQALHLEPPLVLVGRRHLQPVPQTLLQRRAVRLHSPLLRLLVRQLHLQLEHLGLLRLLAQDLARQLLEDAVLLLLHRRLARRRGALARAHALCVAQDGHVLLLLPLPLRQLEGLVLPQVLVDVLPRLVPLLHLGQRLLLLLLHDLGDDLVHHGLLLDELGVGRRLGLVLLRDLLLENLLGRQRLHPPL